MTNGMPPMLLYTLRAGIVSGYAPRIYVGPRVGRKVISPQAPQDGSLWIVILDASNPTNKVQEFIIPGSANTTVPTALDGYMKNPAYLYAVMSQYLSTYYLPQGDLYDYLAAHGAGRDLQRLEQLNNSMGCGGQMFISYALTGQCGPPGSTAAYEVGSSVNPAMMLMSLMPMPNGQPPYSICDTPTFWTR
jgi:hypothetical protein